MGAARNAMTQPIKAVEPECKPQPAKTGIESLESITEFDVCAKATRFLEKLKRVLHKPKVFLASDLHLDHTNIIEYCQRPFHSVEEMNNSIVNNWNSKVRRADTVFFLGDMAFGRGSRDTDYWLHRLKGHIVFIQGSHDRSLTIKFYDKLILKCGTRRFLLVHNPANTPKSWKDWVVHGHMHNKPDYPLVNRKKKTVNVSVELLDYKPLSLDALLALTS